MTTDGLIAASHHDVIVVGAGISGIGAAVHLGEQCPDRTFVILEGRDDIGGTWDLFRYPGVRSDSDMHTLGYSFKPWKAEKSIADAQSIMAYLRETVAEHDIARHVRFGHHVEAASWDSSTARWTITVRHGGVTSTMTCGFLFMCSGYYNYRHGHTPDFPGRDRFNGTIIHPQQWPDDLDYEGRRVVVIGSGATAVTVVPAMADTAAQVTMLQRTPTWMVARPDTDRIANGLRRVLPERLAYAITRAKNTFMQQLVYRKTRTDPDVVRRKLLDGVRAAVGPDVDVDRHFTPDYNPWDQRLCLVPNGDFFTAVRNGKASVVTDTIETFTESGISLTSGEHLDADIIVTATGLELVTLGEVRVSVDGREIDFADTFTYRGVAYSGVPNLVSTFGYINASWTLRADLTSAFVCRLLNHLRSTGTDMVTPTLRPDDAAMAQMPWIDDFSAGYIQRALPLLPKQGDREPWTNPQRYAADRKVLLRGDLEDGVLTFDVAGDRAHATV
jgi:cation diffusion facilitator CzcD-associated flavoprotein CzcO